jgi:hypothetical protein
VAFAAIACGLTDGTGAMLLWRSRMVVWFLSSGR